MSKPLTDEQLREYAELAEKLAGRLDTAPSGGFTFVEASSVVALKSLLAEVTRLREERAAYVATPAQVIRLIRAGEAVVRDAYSEDDDVCEVDASRIKFLESALDDIGPIPEATL